MWCVSLMALPVFPKLEGWSQSTQCPASSLQCILWLQEVLRPGGGGGGGGGGWFLSLASRENISFDWDTFLLWLPAVLRAPEHLGRGLSPAGRGAQQLVSA